MLQLVIVAVLCITVITALAGKSIRYQKRRVHDLEEEVCYAAQEAFSDGWDACAGTYKTAVEPLRKSLVRTS